LSSLWISLRFSRKNHLFVAKSERKRRQVAALQKTTGCYGCPGFRAGILAIGPIERILTFGAAQPGERMHAKADF
jgi:hypothetical protein